MSENLQQQLVRLPRYLGQHVTLVVIALALGVAVSLPASILLARSPRLRWPALAAAGVIQTIPSLALLALMVPLLGGFGFWPALVALVLYSVLPILRNTVTGIAGVDPALTEAARCMGMTSGQVLRRVELPLAAPVILAGIRTATVWVVGTATLATPIGQTSLGNFIFGGLQTRNWTAVLVGCVAAALLALVLDQLIALLESAARSRSRARALGAGIGLALVLGASAVADAVVAWGRGGPRTAAASATLPVERSAVTEVRVGSKTFTEQYVLAALIAARLRDAGLDVDQAESLGSTVAFDALAQDQIDVYVDYTGTVWANTMKRTDARPSWEVLAGITGWLALEAGVRCLGPLGFENAYAFAMRRDRAEELAIRTLDDLARHAPSLRLGADYEFLQRPEWRSARDAYGLRFREAASFDSTFMYGAVERGEVDVITAFSSDGRIDALDLVVLSDPRHAFPPYDAVILLSPRVGGDARVTAALSPLLGAIPVERMRRASLMVDRDEDKKTPAEAAAWLGDTL
ncbi:ABC transporter permease/substrate-binding protein [Sorangium sp. So ce281]|uniref:ABC transporter permease/substrate-binding protein n=1 Tax=unclassified Sorangium TaxID=2621164 RepID=UPI003F62A6BA